MSFNKQNTPVPVITIDGPSGTGKGTVCHLLAQKLGWHILDSGSIYRVLALAAMEQGLFAKQTQELVLLAKKLDLQFPLQANQDPKVVFAGRNISQEIRQESVGQFASEIAAIPEIRQALLERQRDFAKPPGLVTDGRDMGTVVFPNAFLKVYLDASTEERAKRRYFQLKEKGIDVSLADVLSELNIRDNRDKARSASPLKPADDAVCIDTSGMSVVQVLEHVLDLVETRLGSTKGEGA